MKIGMDDTEGNAVKKEKKAAKKAEKIKSVIYYCIKGLYSFVIPEYERDATGEIVIGSNGKPKVLFVTDANGNNRHQVDVLFKFERFPIKDEKTGKTDMLQRVGRFIIEPENPRRDDIINAIEEGRKNKLNGILTEDEYKRHSNAEAFRQEQEKNLLKDKNVELQDENAMLREKLAKAGIEV